MGSYSNKDVKESVSVIRPAKKMLADGSPNPKYPAVPDVELTGVKRTEANEFIFRFNDMGGAVLELREFEPKKRDQDSDEQFKKNQGLTMSRIKHVLRAYLSKEEADKIDADDWVGYVRANMIALGVDAQGTPDKDGFRIPMKAKGIKVDLKVTLRESKGKYYSGLPYVPPFISSKSNPHQFSVDPQYDTMEIPEVKPDAETSAPSASGFGGAAAASAATTESSGHSTGF